MTITSWRKRLGETTAVSTAGPAVHCSQATTPRRPDRLRYWSLRSEVQRDRTKAQRTSDNAAVSSPQSRQTLGSLACRFLFLRINPHGFLGAHDDILVDHDFVYAVHAGKVEHRIEQNPFKN